ncbi:Hypothetical protein SMAX5B_015969 [Scophthalmus maximus]|uniref:Uncharacterized protein n=1 Tax=Scophthalmus maximus TaxID=52904 RepID=A0A2U9CUT2_SCOMX|nr:Hypothetical protein SMAX5B_015969 [Scophthalmus maximus]
MAGMLMIAGLQLERRLATAEKPQRELMIQSEIRVRMFLEQSGVEATAALCSVAQVWAPLTGMGPQSSM